MPICILDEKDYCDRHKTTHVGRLKELALMDNQMGEDYRLLWDRDGANGDYVHACPHRGPQVEENGKPKTIDCGDCPGRVALKVFRCNHPAREPEEITFDDCRKCPYFPRDTSEAQKVILRCGNSEHVLCPGDALVMSAAIYSLHLSHPGKFLTAIDTSANQLFEHNPGVWSPGEHERAEATLVHAEYPAINAYTAAGTVHQLGCNHRGITFMQAYCEGLSDALGVHVPLLTNRPHVYVSYRERSWISQVQEITGRPTRFWLINAGYKIDYTAKWAGTQLYQDVVDKLRGRVQFVQVGADDPHHVHPRLRNVIDLVGKTDHRQLVRLVYHADGVLCGITYLMHLAAALEKPAAVILGGREPVQWNTYPRQHTFHTLGLLPCCRDGGCWRSRVQPLKDGRKEDDSLCEVPVYGDDVVPKCMALIKPDEVAEKITQFCA